MRDSSGLRAAWRTPLECFISGADGSPVAASQRRAAALEEATSKLRPSRLNAMCRRPQERPNGPVRGSPDGTRQVRSSPSPAVAVARRSPSGLKMAAATPSVCPRGGVEGAPVAASHIRAVLSLEAVASHRPSGLNRTCLTASLWATCTLRSPPGRSQRMTEPSFPPVARRLPAGEKATLSTAPPWWRSGVTGFPAVASQARAVPSSLAVANIFPSAENATDWMADLCLTDLGRTAERHLRSQICAAPSSRPVRSRVPSGLSRQSVIQPPQSIGAPLPSAPARSQTFTVLSLQ